jgi:hypothetical protein
MLKLVFPIGPTLTTLFDAEVRIKKFEHVTIGDDADDVKIQVGNV